MSLDNFQNFSRITWGKSCIHAETFHYNLYVLLMFVDIRFQIDFLDITHVDGFVHWEWEKVL